MLGCMTAGNIVTASKREKQTNQVCLVDYMVLEVLNAPVTVVS